MPLSRKLAIILLTVGVFAFGIAQGLRMAAAKALWGDEIFSYDYSINAMSFRQIWAGQAQEGNNSPLFYTLEKAVVEGSGLRDMIGNDWWAVMIDDDLVLPRDRLQRLAGDVLRTLGGEARWGMARVDLLTRWQTRTAFTGRVILRLVPVFFVALGMAVLAWYFARFYSTGVALAALGVLLGAETFWPFWADARPYGMIICFTLGQGLVLLHFIRRGITRRGAAALAGVHLLLVLTSLLSVLQIMAAAGLLVVLRCRDWRLWVTGVAVPLAVAAGYALARTADSVCSFSSFAAAVAVVHSCLPWPWALVLAAATVVLFARRDRGPAKAFLGWWWCVVALYLLMAAALWFQGTPGQGFRIVGRYFLVLMPATVVVLAAVFGEALRSASSLRVRLFLWAAAAAFLFPGVLRAARWVLAGTWPDFMAV